VLRRVRVVEEELAAVGSLDHESLYPQRQSLTGAPRASNSARNASSAVTAASSVSGSTFKEMNIRPLPTLSGHWSEKMRAQLPLGR
jgi:hypothetical protein